MKKTQAMAVRIDSEFFTRRIEEGDDVTDLVSEGYPKLLRATVIGEPSPLSAGFIVELEFESTSDANDWWSVNRLGA